MVVFNIYTMVARFIFFVIFFSGCSFWALGDKKVIVKEEVEIKSLMDSVLKINEELIIDRSNCVNLFIKFKIDSLGNVLTAYIIRSNNIKCPDSYKICEYFVSNVRFHGFYKKLSNFDREGKAILFILPYHSCRFVEEGQSRNINKEEKKKD